jgi:hypothetical protein
MQYIKNPDMTKLDKMTLGDRITLISLLIGSASISLLTIYHMHNITNFIWSITK